MQHFALEILNRFNSGARLEPEHLEHLFSCADCKRAVAANCMPLEQRPAAGAYRGTLDRIAARLPEIQERVRRETAEAQTLLARANATPTERLPSLATELVATSPLVRALVLAFEGMYASDLDRRLGLARLAVALADRLPAGMTNDGAR